MTTACQSNMAAPTPDFRGWRLPPARTASSSISRNTLKMTGHPSSSAAEARGYDMIDIRASKPLAKAIGARRETQRHLECLTRQIMARASRQATTVNVQSQTRRRSGPRTYDRELIDRRTSSSVNSSIATMHLCIIRRHRRTRNEGADAELA